MANVWDAVIGTGAYNITLKRAAEHAEQNGLKLNDDTERVEKVIGLMTMNHSDTGSFFCPCKQSHPLDPGSDVICPCPELPDEIIADGHCYCRLFYSK
jgi:ferredoxin-thioredoxin reductase catalytic chain